jgi:hypothetical protein
MEQGRVDRVRGWVRDRHIKNLYERSPKKRRFGE